MTSPTIDHDGIELITSASTKMDSSDADVISDVEWKQFATYLEIYDPKRILHLGQSCNPKLLRRFFSSNMATRNLYQAAKLGKIDVMKVLLDLGRKDVNKIDNAGQTALHYAAREGHLDIVTMLLANYNINASLRDKHGNTALHYAAKHGHVPVFKEIKLRAPKVDVNSTNDFGETALVLAARRGRKEIVDILLKEPNVVIASPDDESTLLHEAAEHGHAAIVEMILPRMDINSTNRTCKQSPLHLAVQGGHETVVDLLLKAPTVDPTLEDSSGNTPFHCAAKAGNGVIFEKLLQMPGVDVISPNRKGLTALHLAAKYKHANIATMLLEVPNVDPCAKMEMDKTPLHIAAEFGGVDVVQVLLATGKVDVNITDSKKRTAICWATKRGQLHVVELLLRVPNVVPCLRDDNDNTPLHLAAQFKHKDIAEKLLAISHLDMVNEVNKKNETPLFLAAKYGSVDVVDLLLKIPQVDLSICDHLGDSPFDIAVKRRYANIAQELITPPRVVPVHSNKENPLLHLCITGGHEDLVDILLRQSTVDTSAKDVEGNFPIHYAAKNGNTCIFRKILNAPGVDVNSVNDHLDTALHIAVRAGHVDVVNLLVKEPTLNASMRDADGNCPLHLAAKYGEEEIIEKLLEAKGVDVNAKDEDGVTALVLAAKEGHVWFVDKLLDVQGNTILNSAEGGRSKLKTDWGVHSLLLAARNGHHTIIKTLLERGVNVNGTHPSVHSAVQGVVQGFRHNTALSVAIEHGLTEVVEVLLKDPNIDPNQRNSQKEHPLYIAARDGHEEIVRKLMATGRVDVNVLSDFKTALHGAARAGREQIVMTLLKTPGIDVHKEDKVGETALFYAARANNKTILKDIYNASKVDVGSEQRTDQAKLNINHKNNEGDSIIHLAARKNLHNVVDFLREVEHDASVDVKQKSSPPKGEEDKFPPQSPLEIASAARHYQMVKELTKFDTISFTREENGKTILQHMFDDEKHWETFQILRRTEEATAYIEALYKDRQANVDAANAILVGAALIAGVTFASWLQPPLGYTTYYHEQFSDSLPAPPIAYPEYAAFDHHPSLQAFWVFNSLSFFSAIATVISGARSILPAEKLFIKQEVENLRWNLLKTSILLGFSMFFVLLAFATAGVVVLPPVMKFRSNIFSTIAIGGSVCFMFLFSFGRNIYKLRSLIKSSQANKKDFFERWGFKPWHMPKPFTRSKGSIDQG